MNDAETATALTEAAGPAAAASHSAGPVSGRSDRGQRFDDKADSSRSEQPPTEKIDDWYGLEFRVARSMRYHAKRRVFFEHCNQLTRAVSAIAGAGTVATVLQGYPTAAISAGAIVGIASALDLVFDFSKRAMVYDDLYRRFADVGVELASIERTEANFRILSVKALLIEKEEPTSLDVLNVLCSNAELEARGFGYRYYVGAFQRRLAQFGDFGQQAFRRIESSTSA